MSAAKKAGKKAEEREHRLADHSAAVKAEQMAAVKAVSSAALSAGGKAV